MRTHGLGFSCILHSCLELKPERGRWKVLLKLGKLKLFFQVKKEKKLTGPKENDAYQKVKSEKVFCTTTMKAQYLKMLFWY